VADGARLESVCTLIAYRGFESHPLRHRMVACAGPLAPRSCKPRQARKGAAVATDAGAGVRLVQVAATNI
jgi:hypothetical protein